MKSLINREQLNELSQAIQAAVQPSFPRMVSEDKESFQRSLDDFFMVMNRTISSVKAAYQGLNLDEPFTDEIWRQLCINSQFVKSLYALKIKAVADTIGVSDGITNGGILNSRHPNLTKIEIVMVNIMQSLQSTFNKPYCKATIYAQNIVDVNGTPRLSDEAYNDHLSHYQFWVSGEKERNIEVVVEQFAVQYNGFISFLKASGFGHLITGVNGTFMDEIFEQQTNYNLKMLPSTPAFLGKLTKDNIIVA